MSAPPERRAEAERQQLLELLDAARATSRRLTFWWRDDDAVDVTPELEQLLALARRHDLPLALAVIPKPATQALTERISKEPRLRVLQHGWEHKRHSPDTEKKMELGDHRPVGEIVRELRLGFQRLSSLFGGQFLPVLVPPWNRIGASVRAARHSAGLVGLSAFGRKTSPDPHWVNTHVDLFDWTARAPIPRDRAYSLLCRAVESRLAGDPEPIGLLTHHLLYGAESWALLDEILQTLRADPAVSWPTLDMLFGLPEPGPKDG